MNLFTGMSLSFLLLSSALVSSAIFADEAISSTQKNEKKDSWPVISKLKTGFGSFNDVQVPLDYDEATRIDGTIAEPESQTQGGLLFGIDLEVQSPKNDWQFVSRLDAYRLANMSVNPNNSDSSYTMIAVESGMRWNMTSWTLEGLLGYQNQFYSNISTSHILASYTAKLGVSYQLQSGSSVKLFATPSFNPSFSYDNGPQEVEFEGVAADAFAAGAEYNLALNDDSFISFAGTLQQTNVVIKDNSPYEKVGYEIFSFEDRQKQLRLSTMVGSLGFVTVW